MARTKPKSKKKTGVTVNFKGVDGKRSTLPEDDYLVEVEEASQEESGSGNDMIKFVFAVSEGKHKGAKLFLYCPLVENSLWKLRGVLESLGEDIPDDEMDIDLDDLIGKQLMAVVSHESFEGAKRAKMVDFYSVDGAEGDDSDDDEEDDKSSKKSTKKDTKKPASKKASKSKDEDDDEEDDEEESEEDAAAAKAAARKKRRQERKAGKTSKSSDDDDDEEEEEKTSKKPAKGKDKKSSKKKPKKYTSDAVETMDEDELEELVEEAGIEIDLSDFKTLRKKQAGVIDALEDADLLEADDEEDDD